MNTTKEFIFEFEDYKVYLVKNTSTDMTDSEYHIIDTKNHSARRFLINVLKANSRGPLSAYACGANLLPYDVKFKLKDEPIYDYSVIDISIFPFEQLKSIFLAKSCMKTFVCYFASLLNK